MGVIAPIVEGLERATLDISIPSFFEFPDADNKFVEKYNLAARNYKLLADTYRAVSSVDISGVSDTLARFYDVLGVEIDKSKDKWEGLDYKEVRSKGKDRLLFIPSENDVGKHIYLSPPEAGHNGKIIHYKNSFSKSLVLNALDSGLNVWISDKGKAGETDSNFGLEDCVCRGFEDIAYINRETGKKVHVAGFCQGGWEGFLAAYLDQGKCGSLAIGGAPFNWHSEDLSDLTREINPGDRDHRLNVSRLLNLVDEVISRNGGNMPGLWNLSGFIYFSRDQLLHKDPENLLNAAQSNDVKVMERWIDFRPNWFMFPNAMGGKYYQEVSNYLWAENQLFNGVLKIGGERIKLPSFKLSIFALNGGAYKEGRWIQKDNITSRGQQMDLFRKIGTPSDKMFEESVDAGHIGLFMSKLATRSNWRGWFGRIASGEFD